MTRQRFAELPAICERRRPYAAREGCGTGSEGRSHPIMLRSFLAKVKSTEDGDREYACQDEYTHVKAAFD